MNGSQIPRSCFGKLLVQLNPDTKLAYCTKTTTDKTLPIFI